MDWIQTISIIGILGGFTFWIFNRLDNDIQACRNDMKSSHERIDRLYQMFVDLLKEGK